MRKSSTSFFAAVVLALAVFGALPVQAAPGEVVNLQWCPGPKTCLQWDSEPNTTAYRVYRGERTGFPCLLTPSIESCDEGSFATTTTSGTLLDTPPVGSCFWFLVTGTNGSGEGPSGVATTGARIKNQSGACTASCGLSGQNCSVDADCCSASCIAGTCQAACCQSTATFCTADSDCCSGACSGSQCQALCTDASQCPGVDNDCQMRSCIAGFCGFDYAPSGTNTGSQVPGDCHTTVCDGAGGTSNQVNDTDVPDDSNQCTNDSCNNGTPSYQIRPLNSPCSDNGGLVCNGSGACVQCNSSSQCPGTDTECRQRTCSSAMCGFNNTPAGTPTSQQTAGDCHTNVCDGAGGTSNAVNDTDVPDDFNQCTNDSCNNGTPSHQIRPLNSSCTDNGGTFCNGSGACVECNSSSQCPGTDTECRQRTCSSSMCGFNNTPAGTPTSQQTAGDCRTNVCDGGGEIAQAVTDGDVPIDGNPCTDDVCQSGVPSNPPAVANTPCNQDGGTVCDGAGMCVNPPQVVSTTPADGSTAPASTSISVTFSQSMNPATLTGQTIAGACSGSIQVSLDGFASCIAFSTNVATMSGGNSVATLVPQPGLLVNRTYKIRVTTAAQSASAVALPSTFTQPNGFTTQSPNLCDGSLVISQIYGGGGQTGATYRNDFVELHNRGTAAVSLTGYSIQYASAAGTSWGSNQLNLSGSIAAGAYYLIQLASDGAIGAVLPTPNATGAINMSASAGKLALVASQSALSGTCPVGGAIVDFVGFGGTATCNEGGVNAPAGSITTSITRNQLGCADTNVNGSDFAAGVPNPRNGVASPNVCACVARNESSTALEADYCATIFPLTLTVQTATSTGPIYGQLFEAGVTETAGPAATVRAQIGFGPPTANPEYQAGWTWINSTYNLQVGNNDEYQTSFTAPAPGAYRYVYRFSVDQGVGWTYCDNNAGDFGAGSNPGLTFDLENEAVLNVTP